MKAGAKGIRDHPFFSGFDWKGLAERNCLMLMLVLLMHFNQSVRGQVLLPLACWCTSWISAVTVEDEWFTHQHCVTHQLAVSLLTATKHARFTRQVLDWSHWVLPERKSRTMYIPMYIVLHTYYYVSIAHSRPMSWCCCRAFGSSSGATGQRNRWHQQLWPVCRVSYWCWWTPARSCRGTAGLQGLLMAVSSQQTQHWHTDHRSDNYISTECRQAKQHLKLLNHAFASEFIICFLLL